MSDRLPSHNPEKNQTTYIQRIKVIVIQENKETAEQYISDPEDVYLLSFLRKELLLNDREEFICLHLNIKHKLLSWEIVSIGSLNSSVVHPREVFKGAILSNAAALILAHNHPSGDPDPSPEDIAVTKRLIEGGSLLGIEVLDHIIFGDKGFASLKEKGII